MNPSQPIQTSSYSPLGSFPELSAMYNTSFQLPAVEANLRATNANTDVIVKNQEAQAAVDQKKQEFLSDPRNYQQVERPDGGFGFYDPSGKEVSAYQYSQVTGKNISDVLKNSKNPIDSNYIQDAKDLSSYFQARAQAKDDPKQAAIAQHIEETVKHNYGLDLANLPPADVLKAFHQNYPTVYGLQGAGVSGNQLLIPTQETATNYLGGTDKLNKLGRSGGSINLKSANPTGG